jgi:SARP family transcriptional regulator, regulator of embCAB operon
MVGRPVRSANGVTRVGPLEVRHDELMVSVLDTFTFRAGNRALALPSGSRKLLAFLALRDRPAPRHLVAATLWPDASPQDAASSLRSALWRLKPTASAAVIVEDLDLSPHPDVRVDVRESRALAHRVLDPSREIRPGDETAAAIASLSVDILPGWYDDWVVIENEEWHQLRLHALEAMAVHLTRKGRWAESVIAALAAIRAEPLRESAHAALIKVFLAEGNQKEALESFNRYRSMLRAELGIEPTAQITSLVANLGRRHDDP